MTRLVLAAFAVVLATVLVPLGITSSWLSLHVDSTPAYVDTVAPLADDPDLRDALAAEVAQAAVTTLQGNVPVGLPDGLAAVVRTATQEVVDSPGFPEFWREANADAHREFLAIVHEKDEDVVADGWVVVDLRPLLDDVLAEIERDYPVLPIESIPSSPLPMPVIPESELEDARGLYQVLDGLALWAPLLWAGLVGLAVLVAPGWRGRLRAAAACAVGVAIGGAVVLLATAPATDLVVEQVDQENRELARLVVEVVVQTLDDTALGAVVGGLVVGGVLVAGSLWPRRRTHAAHP